MLNFNDQFLSKMAILCGIWSIKDVISLKHKPFPASFCMFVFLSKPKFFKRL